MLWFSAMHGDGGERVQAECLKATKGALYPNCLFQRLSTALRLYLLDSTDSHSSLLTTHTSYFNDATFGILCICLVPRICVRVRSALPTNDQHPSPLPLPLLLATHRALHVVPRRFGSSGDILHRCSVCIPNKRPRRSRDQAG